MGVSKASEKKSALKSVEKCAINSAATATTQHAPRGGPIKGHIPLSRTFDFARPWQNPIKAPEMQVASVFSLAKVHTHIVNAFFYDIMQKLYTFLS